MPNISINTLYIIVFFTIALNVTAQNGRNINGAGNGSTFDGRSISQIEFDKFLEQKENIASYDLSKFKGSPYLIDEFSRGSFSIINDSSSQLQLRYNMYSDEIEMKNPDGSISSFFKVYNTQFQIENYLIQLHLIEENGFAKKANLIVLVNGNHQLFARKKVMLIQPEKAVNPNHTDRSGKFITQTSYYFKDKGNFLHLLSKKTLLAQYPEDIYHLGSFIRENKLKLKKVEDLITIFSHINTLNL